MSLRILAGSATLNSCCNSLMSSPKVRWPLQRSRICRPVPCSFIAPSGNKMTRSCSVPPQRQPAARRGWLESSGGAILRRLNLEGARRRPSRLHIREVKRVELRPQNVAFVAQSLHRQFLFGARFRVVVDIVYGELRVLRGLVQPRLEIIETAGEPGVVLA